MAELRNPDDTFQSVKVYFPRSIYNLLKMHSEKMKVPLSRVVQYAVDNELDAPAPFVYPVEEAKNVFIPDAYAEEAQLLARFLVKFASGAGRDQLLLCRRDAGIANKETFMCALRELFEANVIEEVKVPGTVKFKKYHHEHRYVRLKHQDRTALLARKKRLIAKQQQELEDMENLIVDKKPKYGEVDDGP